MPNLKNVRIHKDLAQPIEFYKKANVFLFPTRYEGVANVVLEAMASALPIITTSAAVPHEMITEKEGIILNHENLLPEKVVDEILKLYNSPELREKLGNAAREKALREFQWDKTADDYLKVYNKVIELKSG